MLVYGHRSFTVPVRTFLRGFLQAIQQLATSPSHDELIGLLVDFGEVESAVADTLQPEFDDERPDVAAWEAALSAAADAVCSSWSGDAAQVEAATAELRSHVGALESAPQPETVSARVAEGFAQYALYPEQYIEAAGQFVATVHPAGVVCIGLRSIGAALAHVVAAALSRAGVPAAVRCVRPRGHPWDRRLRITDALANAISTTGASHFAVVDEGPGLSGSSFASAVDALVALGIDRERIVLFPSWRAPAGALRADRARALWSQHRQFVTTFETTWLDTGRLLGATPVEDLSAGAWRRRLPGTAEEQWPPVQPQHERRKYLQQDAPVLFRFAGLGRHGAGKFERAQRLAAAGYGPDPVEIRHGFLARAWIDGAPQRSLSGENAISRIAAYLAFVGREFATGNRALTSDLAGMIRHNLSEDSALCDGEMLSRPVIDAVVDTAGSFDEPEIAVDGRLLPYEWIASGARLFKVDALDHHADDFLPGCRDIAWDVAGAIVENGFDTASRQFLVGEYARLSGDIRIGARLPFYTAAYAAYRLGYVTLAADTLGDTRDGRAFRQSASRYRRSLGALAPPSR